MKSIRVLTSNSVTYFGAVPYSFDLVITDFSMPNMTGYELAQQVKVIRSDLPIVLISGYDGGIEDSRAAFVGIREIVSKPFTIEKLATVLHRVLQRSEKESGI